MLSYTAAQINEVTGGILLQGEPGIKINNVSTDSRKVKSGDLFVALKGQQVDGHDYLFKALENGAGALLVSRRLEGLPGDVVVIQVADTLRALQQLASHNRQRLNIPVIAVTGSNGKTSTKDMIAAVLSTRFQTLKTEGNYNNELGLPLTLLNLQEDHQAAVVEMGMRGRGEIDFLARLTKPTGAVITNIGESHLERLGSVKNIALAKTEVLKHIGEDGFAVLNGDSPFVQELSKQCKGKIILYSLEGEADIKGFNIRPEGSGVRYDITFPGGEGEIFLPVPGSHNVMNSMAAVGVGLQLGLKFPDIAEGLAKVVLTHMRLEIIESSDMTIINDTYNANPSSVKAALKVLKEIARGRKIAVLGNMYELGEQEQVGHQDVGAAAASIGVDYLITVGNLAQWIRTGAIGAGISPDKVHWCEKNNQAVEVLHSTLKPGDTILIKGSRGMRMEEIVKRLSER